MSITREQKRWLSAGLILTGLIIGVFFGNGSVIISIPAILIELTGVYIAITYMFEKRRTRARWLLAILSIGLLYSIFVYFQMH